MASPALDPRPPAPREFLASLGRLEDEGGAESARERLRGFLLERATTPDAIRLCLDSCRTAFGEQHRRALQDIVLVAGRLLGFEIAFGRYARPDGVGPRAAGSWSWRGRLHVRLLVWSDPLADDVATIHRQVLAAEQTRVTATEPHAPSLVPSIVLCVTAPTFGASARLEAALAGAASSPASPVEVRVISLDALLVLATLVSQGMVRRDEALRELRPPVSLDDRIALLTRLVDTGGMEDAARRFGVAPLPASCWIYVTRDDHARTLGSLPIQRAAALQVRAGDVVCVLTHGTGLTARADVAGVAEDDARGVAGGIDGGDAAPHFRITLRRMRTLDPPRPVGIDQQFDLEMQAAVSKGPLVWVTRSVFDGLVGG